MVVFAFELFRLATRPSTHFLTRAGSMIELEETQVVYRYSVDGTDDNDDNDDCEKNSSNVDIELKM